MAAKKPAKSNIQLANDKELKKIVNESIEEMDRMKLSLTSTGMNEADAELTVKQAYFKNLKMAGQPAVMMQKTMAELSTRIELDRIINPEQDLVSDKYQQLIELQMKALKTQASLEKKVTLNVQNADDRSMNFDFIDVEES